jgi:two-component system response regulator YesN
LIKLLVVEDESVTRKNLIKHVKWSELGVDVIEEARDGIEGLETARRLQPDIVVSDIRMPGMNGIDFTFNVRKQFPDCRIIYLSGYSDKEYLKAAIRINAVSYVEKPINIDEFQAAVKKAVDLCREHYRIKETENKINLALSESLPFIYKKIVNGLIHNNMDCEELKRNLDLAGISLDRHSAYTVSILVPSYEQDVMDDEKQRCCRRIVDMLNHASDSFTHLAVIENFNRIFVISAHQPENRKDFAKIYSLILEHLKETQSRCSTLSWVVGSPASGWEEISGSYQTADQFLKYLFFYDSGGIYDAHNRTGSVYRFPDDIIPTFSALLQDLEEDKILQFIEKCYQDIKPHTGTPADEVKNLFYQMMRMMVEEGEKRGVPLSLSSRRQENYDWAVMSRIETLKQLKEVVQEKTKSILDQIAHLESNSRAVLEVMKYIRRHYSNKEITVKQLADHVHLAPTYLSSLFKKETGKTISEYLTEIRIEKSAELLIQPQAKLFEVADQSGYYDANYFSKVFKKIKGMTPSQFRRKYKS